MALQYIYENRQLFHCGKSIMVVIKYKVTETK